MSAPFSSSSSPAPAAAETPSVSIPVALGGLLKLLEPLPASGSVGGGGSGGGGGASSAEPPGASGGSTNRGRFAFSLALRAGDAEADAALAKV